MSNHIVVMHADMDLRTPPEFEGRSVGYTGQSVVDEPSGGVQMGFRVAALQPGGHVDTHVHSFEESRLAQAKASPCGHRMRHHARQGAPGGGRLLMKYTWSARSR
jgi:hypothetical protein